MLPEEQDAIASQSLETLQDEAAWKEKLARDPGKLRRPTEEARRVWRRQDSGQEELRRLLNLEWQKNVALEPSPNKLDLVQFPRGTSTLVGTVVEILSRDTLLVETSDDERVSTGFHRVPVRDAHILWQAAP